MLAKLWKKILLSICIIAILFNITSKLVRRYSLETQLNSVVDGDSLSDIFKNEEEEDTNKTTTKSNNKNSNIEDDKNYFDEDEDDEEDQDYTEDDDDF